MSVVPLIVPVLDPPDLLNSIVALPPVIRFEFASLAVRVKVAFELDAMVAELTVTTDVAAEMAPGMTVTVGGVDVTGDPPIVAEIVVGLPEIMPVNMAE